MIYIVEKESVFIPKWNNNENLDKGEQISIGINHPSALDVSQAMNKADGDNMVSDFLMHVKWIKGIKIKDGNKTRDVEPIDIVKEPGLLELFVEIKSYIKEFNTIDKKKLK